MGIDPNNNCRSNETHLAWRQTFHNNGNDDFCTVETLESATKDAARYLRTNMMEFDKFNAASLGLLPCPSSSSITAITAADVVDDPLPDGLCDGIINRTIYHSLQTKITYPWADALPKSIYWEYVLNYASVNEARTNWRPLFVQNLHPLLPPILLHQNQLGKQQKQEQQEEEDDDISSMINRVVRIINQQLWFLLASSPTKPIHFVSGQTPLIYDPMSIIAYGYGSCTGLSIFLVNALRACGIAARLAGTPAWNGNVEHGNHNWVEVYRPNLPNKSLSNLPMNNNNVATDNGFNKKQQQQQRKEESSEWVFLEPAYGDYGDNVDDLQRNPCRRWFCNAKHFDGKTQVFAARLDQSLLLKNKKCYYPMAWDEQNHCVPGEDRSDYYTNLCSQCD